MAAVFLDVGAPLNCCNHERSRLRRTKSQEGRPAAVNRHKISDSLRTEAELKIAMIMRPKQALASPEGTNVQQSEVISRDVRSSSC